MSRPLRDKHPHRSHLWIGVPLLPGLLCEFLDESLHTGGDDLPGARQLLAGSWHVVPVLDPRPRWGQVTDITPQRDHAERRPELLLRHTPWRIVRNVKS